MRSTELRNACLAKSHELAMGIVAMRVLGAGMLSGFGRKDLEGLPGAACRDLFQDQRVHNPNISMRFPDEIDANSKVFTGDRTYTNEDRGMPAAVGAGSLNDEYVCKMPVG